VGLGFGDEGKGKVIDHLARARGASVVVRYGGGPQAAHHVVLKNGAWHCFAQFASGALAGASSVISRGMLVDPLALAPEAESLRRAGIDDPFASLSIDPRCRVVSPLHKIVSRMREIGRGASKRGTCGRGVGEAVRDAKRLGHDALRIGDLSDVSVVRRKLRIARASCLDLGDQIVTESHGLARLDSMLAALRQAPIDTLSIAMVDAMHPGPRIEHDRVLSPLLHDDEPLVFEGAHGVLLDATHGYSPHVTSTDTSFTPADSLISELAPGLTPFRLGVVRAYATRHGAGPFPTEDPTLARRLPEAHNVASEWQGPMRAGWLDLVAIRHAIESVGGVDAIALTHLDRLSGLGRIRVASSYEREGDDERRSARPEPGCRATYSDFAGWKQGIGDVRTFASLPENARSFVRFLASTEGLATPIAIVSVGPTAADTITLGDADRE
jgi:adenylosuccinate synthase